MHLTGPDPLTSVSWKSNIHDKPLGHFLHVEVSVVITVSSVEGLLLELKHFVTLPMTLLITSIFMIVSQYYASIFSCRNII